MTPKQKRFVEEYLSNGFNATEAAKSAKYSDKTAQSQGQRLLTNVAIKAEIDKKQQKLSKKCEIKTEKVISELVKIAFSNMGDVAEWGTVHVPAHICEDTEYLIDAHDIDTVQLKHSIELSPEVLACVQEVSKTQNGIKVKLYDKQKALDMLGKYLGMFVDRHEHTGKDGNPIEVMPAVDHKLVAERVAFLLKEAETDDTMEEFE